MKENILKSYLTLISIIIAVIFFVSERLFCQSVLDIEQTLNVYGISDVHISPTSEHIAFVVSEPVEGTTQKRDIWVYYTETKELRQFTSAEKSSGSPRWSPDGSTIAFTSSRHDKNQIYLIPVNGGEAVKLTDSETGVGSFEWSPDGRSIVFTARDPKDGELKEKEKNKDDAKIADKGQQNSRIRLIDILSKDTVTLTDPKWRISEFAWTPDSKNLIVSASDNPFPEFESNRIFKLPVSGGDMIQIATPHGPFGSMKVSPDGKYVALSASRSHGPTAMDIYMMPISGPDADSYSEKSIDRSVGGYIWTGDHELLARFQSGFDNVFYKITSATDAVKTGEFDVDPSGSFDIKNNVFAYVGGTSTQMPELWVSLDGGKAEKVTSFNNKWNSIALIKPEKVKYKSFDGLEIEAELFKPEGHALDKTYPAIILVHGGPSGRWANRFNSWAQLLASRGFVVFCPNIRGSTGYGHEFIVSNRYDWGGGDWKDVLAGADYIVENNIADPEKLGIGGWSYGGYLAAWAVGQTDRFKASVSGAPMTDLVHEYGTEVPSINAYDTWYMGNPYENLDRFIERSPTTYIKNVKTPTLILCGENDVIDPIGQCREFYRGLKRYGVDTEFVTYPREGHGLREEMHRIDMLERMVDWFEKYVK